jgi:hypothetical protein
MHVSTCMCVRILQVNSAGVEQYAYTSQASNICPCTYIHRKREIAYLVDKSVPALQTAASWKVLCYLRPVAHAELFHKLQKSI